MPLASSSAVATDVGWSVCCAACGSCCNSPPLLSLPELFRHPHLFIGVLGLRRVRRVRAGDSLGHGRLSYAASAADGAAVEGIANDCLHAIPGEGDHDLLLSALGFDDPGLGRCPALGPDRRCTLHSRPKPVICAAVPFEPLLPDRLQHVVIAERWADGDDLGARCIARAHAAGHESVRGSRVTDDHVRRALRAARRALADDKRFWGHALLAQLAAEPELLARIPTDAFLVVPLAPVLDTIAAVSERCRQRCLDYLDAQLVLCERVGRGGTAGQRLRPIVQASRVLRDGLVERGPGRCDEGAARDVESWLEPGESAVSVFLGGDGWA